MVAKMGAMRFDEKVSRLMEDRRLNAADLARLVGVSKNTTGRWVNGQNRPYDPVLVRLARLLGTTVDYLADDAQDEPPAPDLSEDDRRVLWLVHAAGLSADDVARALAGQAGRAPSAAPAGVLPNGYLVPGPVEEVPDEEFFGDPEAVKKPATPPSRPVRRR